MTGEGQDKSGPRITVIVPLFNAENRIEACVGSILDQTYQNLELIVVNDGSTDGSLEAVTAAVKSDPRAVVISQENKGVSNARNVGLERASGEFVGFVDADDTIQPLMYQRLVERIQRDNTDAAVLASHSVRPKPLPLEKSALVISSRKALASLLRLELPTSMWAYLYRADLVRSLKCDEDLHFFEDFAFNFIFLQNAQSISILAERCYNYRINEGSINSQSLNAKHLSVLRVYDSTVLSAVSHDPRLEETAQFFRAHALMSVLSKMASSAGVSARSQILVKAHAARMRRQVWQSRHTTEGQRLLVLMASVSPQVAILAFAIRQRVRRVGRRFAPDSPNGTILEG